MKRISFLSLVTILFLLFSLSPADLARASDGDVLDRAVPNAGHWSGTTSRGQPMSFDVSAGGIQWLNFKLKTDFQIGSCSGTVEYTVPGPGAITSDAFSRSLSTFSFAGQFTSLYTASGTYSFVNESITGCGTFSQSGTWSASLPMPAPGAFSKLSPADAVTGQPTSLTLNWGASTDASSYEYCYGTTNPCSNWTDNGASTSKTLSGLTPDSTYYWQVRARNATGTTLANAGTWWSFSVTQTYFVYLPLVIKPAPLPGGFAKIEPVNNAVDQSVSPSLSWSASSDATGYEYCLDTSNDNTCNGAGAWTSTTSTSVALSGLARSTHYYWQVRANNAGGSLEADGGTWWSFTTTSILPPGAFNKSGPANGANSVPTNRTLTWATSSRASSYEYCIDTINDSTCNGSGTWISTATSTSAALSGLLGSTTYYWQVRAINLSGTTEANGGTWWSFTTVAPSGPTPGYWKSTTGDEFYVTPDQANVINFAVTFYVSQCGATVTAGRTTPVPIVNKKTFSFTGTLYASGTFDSPTTAHGTDGVSSLYVYNCGYVTGGPWSWTATWQDSSQPAPDALGDVISSVTILPSPAPDAHWIDKP